MKLMDELKTYVSEGNKILEALEAEARNLTDLNREVEAGDAKRLKEIRAEYKALNKKLDEVEADITELEALDSKINELTNQISKQKNELLKLIATDKLDEFKAEEEMLEEEIRERHSDILSEAEVTEVVESEEAKDEKTARVKKKKTNKVLVAIAAGAGTIAIAAGCYFGIKTLIENNNKKSIKDNDDKKVEDTTKEMPETNNTINYDSKTNTATIVDTRTFTDVTDKEQVAKRANEIVEDIKNSIPNANISKETIIELMNWVNGGVVEDASLDRENEMINLVTSILNAEQELKISDNLEAIKNAPKGTEGDIASDKERELFDYSKLFLDGSKGQMLAKESYEIRKAIFKTIGTAEVNNECVKLTELFATSFYSKDINKDINGLENSFSKLVNLKVMADTTMHADFDGFIYATINGKKYELLDTFLAFYGQCPEVNSEVQANTYDSLKITALDEALNNKDVNVLTKIRG